LQNAPVAQLIAPERVMLLGASHPHNAFLQLWVELGLVGVLLVCALSVLFFVHVMQKAQPWLRPFWLAWFAMVAAIALVSHGAWQPWWMSVIGASVAGFMALEKDRP
jgi:O-antigen ligase